MALPESAVSELLDAFRAGDGVDLVRESVRLVLQEVIEAEACEVIGAGRYERTGERTNERNGNRPRLFWSRGGNVELAIPKPRVVLPVDPRSSNLVDASTMPSTRS